MSPAPSARRRDPGSVVRAKGPRPGLRPASATAARSLLVAAALVAATAAAASAASAAPSASPPEGTITALVAWLDSPIAPDARPGDAIPIGVTIWDIARGRLSEAPPSYLKLHPATGSAPPTEARATSDWPGHVVAEIVVPRGGPGAVEVGVRGRACTTDGTCKDVDAPFLSGGVGPPPEAPRSALVIATLHALPRPLLAGAPIDVVVDLQPRAPWEPAALGLPDQLIAIVNQAGGPDLATAEIHSASAGGVEPGRTYSGQITIPVVGEVTLMVAIPGNGTEDDVLPTTVSRLTVGGTPVAGSPRPGAPAPSPAPADGGVPWLALAGVAVLVLVGGAVVRRVFADL